MASRRWRQSVRRHLVLVLAGAMLASGLTWTPHVAHAGNQRGIDVSEFQGSINWSQVRSAGIDFAWIRAGDGTYVDPDFATNWSGAVGAGVNPGAYLFFEPSVDATAQANSFINQLSNAGFRTGQVLPALDVEVTGGQSPAAIVSGLHTAANRIQTAFGQMPAIYTSPSWWDSNVNSSDFTGDPLWVAHWCSADGTASGGCPALPANSWGGNGYEAWQYADNGSVSGISGSVDLDEGNPSPPIYGAAPPPPSINAITPQTGSTSGGTAIAVSGLRFSRTSVVHVGGVAVTSVCNGSPPSNAPCFSVEDWTDLILYTPAESPGRVDITVTTPNGTTAQSASDQYTYVAAGTYTPLTPFRILDTRSSSCVNCANLGQIGQGQIRAVRVAGLTGPNGQSVPSSALSVVLNVTVSQATSASYVTIFPTGVGVPNASNLNFDASTNVANLVVVGLGSDGNVNAYNSVGSVDLIIDVQGYFASPTASTPGGTFHPIAPLRMCDTRAGSGTACSGSTTDNALGAGAVTRVVIGGVPSGTPTSTPHVPQDVTVAAAALNLTATQGSTDTFLSVFPPDTGDSCAYNTPPSFSNLNVNTGINRPNRVIVPLGPHQDVCVFNSRGSIDFVIDVNGWFGSGHEPSLGSFFFSEPPTRACDTRGGTGTACSGVSLQSDASNTVQLAGVAGVPPVEGGTSPLAVIANVTATRAQWATYYTLYPSDVGRPTASDLNSPPATDIPNLAIVQLSTAGGSPGAVNVYNASGTSDVILDVEGWFQPGQSVPGPDGSAPGGLAVSATVEPSNGHVDVSARGPQSATYFYWDIGGSWNGPLALGGVGSADSAPSIGVESNGTVDVVVQGPNHALYFYWQIAGSWYGPYSIAGNDVAYSTPSLAPDGAGHVYVAVKGPANRLDVWLDSGGAWTGPTTLGDADTTFSAPSVVEESPSTVLIGAVGLQNQETIYRNVSGVWQAPTSSAAGTAYSPSLGDIAFMGPSNALEAYQPSGPSYATVAGAGSSYSAPSGDAAATYLAVEGAGHALDYFALSGGSYHAQRLDTSVAYSAPSLTFEPNGHQDLALQGPSNTLYVYWLIGSTWYGPLAIGGAGTTYSSGS